jgi:hypothetical protein
MSCVHSQPVLLERIYYSQRHWDVCFLLICGKR